MTTYLLVFTSYYDIILFCKSIGISFENLRGETVNSAVHTNISSRGKPRLMLHSCCGPCSTSVIERLIENYNLTVFFYNPNIVNGEEYKRRLETQEKVDGRAHV